jgi:hypothetical protein
MTRIGVGVVAGGVLGGALYGLGHLAVKAAERVAYPKGVPATQAQAEIARAEGQMRGEQTPDEMLGTAPAAKGGQALPMERQIIEGLMSRGLSLPVARGITANMIAESGLNPGINEIAPLVPGSRGGFGLNQWTGPRRRQLEEYAEQQGRPIDDLDLQLDFTIWELGNTERAAMDALSGVNDPVEAARIYSERFLRPGIPHMDRRLAEARRLAGLGAPEGVTPYVPTPYVPSSRGYTGAGQVKAGDEFTLDVEYRVVDMASLTRATGDLQPRDRSRINSDDWIAATAARLDPAKLMPNPDASTGTPIIGPSGVIESGNGRVSVIDRAYTLHPDRATAYRAQIEAAGFKIPQGMERPVLVALRKTPLDDAQLKQMTLAAQDSGVAQMTPTEVARASARVMDAQVLAGLHRDLPIDHSANAEFVSKVMAGLPRSARNSMINKTGGLNGPGLRQLREALFARAWPDEDILARFTETSPEELKSLVEALDAAAPTWATLRGDIEAGLVRPEMDIGVYVLDAMRMIAAAREAAAMGGPSIAGVLEDLLNQIDMISGPLSPLTTALVRKFWQNGRAAKSSTIADLLTRYAQDARVAGRTGQMIDGPSPADVLRQIDPKTFADVPDDLGRSRAMAQDPLPQVQLPEAGLEEGALSPDAIEADAAAADDLTAAQDGPFGPILTVPKGDWRAAIAELTRRKTGEVPDALSHPAAPEIALVWGVAGDGPNTGYGLAKIIARHPEVLADLQGRLDATELVSTSANRIRLESDQDMFVVRLDAEGDKKTWLLTAYEKKQQGAGRTTVRPDGAPEGSSPSAPLPFEDSASARLDQEADAIDQQIAPRPELDAAFAAYPIDMPDGSTRTAAEVLRDLDDDAQFDAFIQACAITPNSTGGEPA